MRVTLCHNPTAGDGDCDAETILRLLWESGYRPRYQSTKAKDWKAILDKPADLIVAAGGDGTVTKVMSALPSDDVPVAVLPLGTANNIATGLGMMRPIADVVASWRRGKPHRYDLWQVESPWGKKLLIEGGGIGIITVAAAELSGIGLDSLGQERKLASARKAIASLAEQCAPFSIRARCNDVWIEDRFLLFELMNVGLAGPRLCLAPVDPCDGLLDIAVVRESEGEAFAEWIRDGAKRPWHGEPSLRCEELNLEWAEGRFRTGDGVFWPEDDDENIAGGWIKAVHSGRTLDVMAAFEDRTREETPPIDENPAAEKPVLPAGSP